MKSGFRKPTASLGFTLVETLIALGISGLLASLAFPAWQDAVLKGRRAQARVALQELIQSQERYRDRHNAYLAFSNAAGAVDPPAAAGLFRVQAGDPQAPVYHLSAGACSGAALDDCIQAVARPVAPDDVVGDLLIDSTGARGCTGRRPASCWP